MSGFPNLNAWERSTPENAGVNPEYDHMCQECDALIPEDEWEMFKGFCEECYEEGLI